jgi:16S rRNA (cytosine967-C5)-methyltransferase
MSLNRYIKLKRGDRLEILTADGDLRTLPCHLPHDDPRLGGLDGFYAARLVKS